MLMVTPQWSKWDAFRKDFMVCWLPVDEAKVALAQLERLRQGLKEMVAQYATKFSDITGHTNLEDHGKHAYFVCGLNANSEFLLRLANMVAPKDKKATTFLDTIAKAKDMDAVGTNLLAGLLGAASAASVPAVNPYAMDVNIGGIAATNTGGASSGKMWIDYVCTMRGRCFGCGSNQHQKGLGMCGARAVKCRYCNCTSHLERICKDKFCGCTCNHGNTCVAADNVNFMLFLGEVGIQGYATIAATNTITAAPAATAPATAPAIAPTVAPAAAVANVNDYNITALANLLLPHLHQHFQ